MAKLLSVLIPARNEVFLQRTIEDVLANARGETEVIAVLDGYWPTPPVLDDPRVTLIHHTSPVGQRAATNEAAQLSTAKYVMKLDAHCAVDAGFDVKLAADCEPDWTVLPRMHNLIAFKWVCSCGREFGQGPRPECHEVRMEILWQRNEGRGKVTDFMFIDQDLRAQYFDGRQKRKYRWRDHYARHATGEVCDVMVGMGPGWFMERERFWQLGGLDEGHGGWGQMGVEIACKSWLSGGRQVVNRKTWFAHLFRTRKDFSFPYPISDAAMDAARAYSRDLWLNDKWPMATRPFKWLLEHFAPVPGWTRPWNDDFFDSLGDPPGIRIE